MVIYEHVKGILSVPCYLDNGDYAGYTTDISFTDSDIIRDSCSIKSSACDSSTFSLGSVRPAELSIQLHLEQDGINAYNLYGAKIILYSCYQKEPAPSDWIFRGMFWVTSVSRKKTLYTLRASDALVWLNNNSISSGSGKVDNDESEVSKKLRYKLEGYEGGGEDVGGGGGGGIYSLHEIVTDIVAWTNDILQNMIAEKPLTYEHIDSIPNDAPQLGNLCQGYTLMRKSYEGESKNTRYSAIDYISALAKPACSFVCMRNDRYQNNDSQVPFSLVPFGFFKDKITEAIERDTLAYLEKNKLQLRNENSTLSDFYKTSNLDYAVRLQYRQKGVNLIDLTLTVKTREQAEAICANWKNATEDVYGYLMDILIK